MSSSAVSQGDSLRAKILDLYRISTVSLSTSRLDEAQVRDWEVVEEVLQEQSRNGTLEKQTAKVCWEVGRNVQIQIETVLRLVKASDSNIAALSDRFERLLSDSMSRAIRTREFELREPVRSSKRRDLDEQDSRFGPENKRFRRELAMSQTPDVQNTCNHTRHSAPLAPPAVDPIRTFFLTNLSNPFPTPSQKEAIAKATGCKKKKVESDLTNWRRRSGWSAIREKWCGGDLTRMRKLIEGVQAGKEKRQEVLEEVEKCRAYLERREEEKAGEWVLELTAAAKKGLPIPLPRDKATEVDQSYESDGQLSQHQLDKVYHSSDEEEDVEEEPESESDEEYPTLAAVPTVPTPTTPVQIPPRGSPESEQSNILHGSPLQAIDDASSIDDHAAAEEEDDRVGDLHDSPSRQFVYAQPPWPVYTHHPLPPAFPFPYVYPGPIRPYSHHYTLSTQTSYSSLSGASAQIDLASPSLRSVSSSSAQSNISGIALADIELQHRKRSAPAELFSRSSRIRQEGEGSASDGGTEARWVTGFAPGKGFHIGSTAPVVPYGYLPPGYAVPVKHAQGYVWQPIYPAHYDPTYQVRARDQPHEAPGTSHVPQHQLQPLHESPPPLSTIFNTNAKMDLLPHVSGSSRKSKSNDFRLPKKHAFKPDYTWARRGEP